MTANGMFLSDPCVNWVGILCFVGMNQSNVGMINLSGFSARTTIPSTIGRLSSLSSLRILNLGFNNLRGTLPSEIGLLSTLRSLTLSLNGWFPGFGLSGSLPSSLYNLRSLSFLDLGVNRFSGSISHEILRLRNLQTFWVNSNFLSGSVPSQIFKLPRINSISLSTNRLRGSLPQNVGQPGPRLVQLNVDGNALSGTLPSSLGALVGVTRLLLSCPSLPTACRNPRNAWSGRIPTELGRLQRLRSLVFWNTRLSGPIPTTLGSLSSLTHLVFRNCHLLSGSIPSSLGRLPLIGLQIVKNARLGGTFPSEIGSLSALTILDIAVSRVAGNLPSALGRLTRLRVMRIFGNSLVGSIPPTLGLLTNLNTLWLQSNRLGGTVPTQIGTLARLQYMTIADNSIRGSLPTELGNLLSLNTFKAEGNLLRGQIPSQLSFLTRLVTIDLRLNYFSGTLPPQFSLLTRLTTLDLEGNALNRGRRITGTIPTTYSSLSSLKALNFGFQDIRGCLPSFVSSFRNMTSLKFSENRFGCSIPSSWSSLGLLTELFLEGNSITGTIPSFIGNMNGMQILLLYNNKLRGVVPSSLGSLTRMRILSLANNLLSGQVPSTFAALTRLETLILYSNRFTGPLSMWLGKFARLRGLDIQDNRFSSTIPLTIKSLRSLQLFTIQCNRLTGTITPLIGVLGNLSLFNASFNALAGPLPSQLGQLSMLQYMDLSSNKLTSSLPPSLARLSSLLYLFLESNSLVGPIPTAFGSSGSLTRLQQIRLRNNRLTGGIPTQLGLLSSLVNLYLSNNTLGGTLPTQLGQISGLHSLYLDRNGLIGTLPAVLCSSWTRMSKLRLGYNSISGTLPSTFTMMTAITSVRFPNNLFVGKLPRDFAPLRFLKNWQVPYSRFTGPIPSSLGLLKTLSFISMAGNFLTGTLPTQLSGLRSLTYLDVHANNLVSDPTLGLDFFNVNSTPRLSYFDVSANNFSGPLPSKVLSLPSLQTVVLARNCFSGPLPATICNSKRLRDVVLDGLAAGDGCQKALWPKDNSLKFDATLAHTMVGTVPRCLWRLPKLVLLHLAGNGFTGPGFDPQLKSWPANLSDLSLSNNMLSQAIPSPLQHQAAQLAKLDLSYNKFDGTLSDMTLPSSLIFMLVNRFSGSLSPALIRKPAKPMNFSILAGNAFSCSDKSLGMPTFDPFFEDVQCGSNSMNIYMYVLSGLILCVAFGRFWLGQQLQGDHEEKGEALDSLPHIKVFLGLTTQLLRLLLVFSVIAVLLLFPIYGVLTATSATQTDSYLWTISASYKRGASTAIGLFFLFLVTLTAAFTLVLRHQALVLRGCGDEIASEAAGVQQQEDSGGEDDAPQQHGRAWSDDAVLRVLAFRLIFVFLLNAVVTITINVGFVFLMNIATAQQQTLAQIGMSVLNAVWEFVLKFLLSTKLLYFGLEVNDIQASLRRKPFISTFREGEVFTASLGIWTQLTAPMVASMVASPNCFKPLFYQPDPVESSYFAPVSYVEYLDSMAMTFNPTTLTLSVVKASSSFVNTDVVTNEISFVAPFQYLYQCSSAILASYAPVMLNTAITKAFAGPLKLFVVRQMLNRGVVPKAAYSKLLHLLPKLSWTRQERQQEFDIFIAKLREKDLGKTLVLLSSRELNKKFKHEIDTQRKLWDRDAFFVDLITDFALLLSFGVACPPLAVALIVSILSGVLVQRHLVAAFVAFTSAPSYIKDSKQLQAIITADTINAGDVDELIQLEQDVKFDIEGSPLFYARWMVLTMASSFLAFFVFDTAGDQQGPDGAAWGPLVQSFVPLLIAGFIEALFRLRFLQTHADIEADKLRSANRNSSGQRRDSLQGFQSKSFTFPRARPSPSSTRTSVDPRSSRGEDQKPRGRSSSRLSLAGQIVNNPTSVVLSSMQPPSYSSTTRSPQHRITYHGEQNQTSIDFHQL